MNDQPKRRFYAGNSLRQALVLAASHYDLPAEEIAYTPIEKRHGFLKTRRRVVIEVDPDNPRRQGGAEAPAPVVEAAPVAPTSIAPEPVAPAPAAPRREPEERPVIRREAGERRPYGGERGGRGEGRTRDRGEREERFAPPRVPPPPPRGNRAEREPAARDADGELIALPEAPRRTSERYPPATGPIAEAAERGLRHLLEVAGLELSFHIHQGEGRLEIELAGEDTEICSGEEGELLRAIEHLLPRLVRTLAGEPIPCRVDCDNFHEIREERLRSMAQREADEVRRRGRARTLEPMNPADRRIIHITLADDPAVETESEGEGYFQRITIRPAPKSDRQRFPSPE